MKVSALSALHILIDSLEKYGFRAQSFRLLDIWSNHMIIVTQRSFFLFLFFFYVYLLYMVIYTCSKCWKWKKKADQQCFGPYISSGYISFHAKTLLNIEPCILGLVEEKEINLRWNYELVSSSILCCIASFLNYNSIISNNAEIYWSKQLIVFL